MSGMCSSWCGSMLNSMFAYMLTTKGFESSPCFKIFIFFFNRPIGSTAQYGDSVPQLHSVKREIAEDSLGRRQQRNDGGSDKPALAGQTQLAAPKRHRRSRHLVTRAQNG